MMGRSHHRTEAIQRAETMRKIRASKQETRSQEEFRAGFDDLMQRMGAVPSEGMYDWTIATPAGPLGLACGRFDPPGSRTIFGRFDDPKGAARVAWVNPYSGKWNHHYFGQDNREYLEDFERQLRGVLRISSPEIPIDAKECKRCLNYVPRDLEDSSDFCSEDCRVEWETDNPEEIP
jgi:hypothetical protein